MSTQSIKDINIKYICNKIDDFLICEGKYFINMINYDLKDKVNYNKIDIILWLKGLISKCENQEEVLLLIDKKLMK